MEGIEMSCGQCKKFLSFAGNQGINEVTMDGMCTKMGLNDPVQWTPRQKDGTCLNDTTPKIPALQGLQIKPNSNTQQILANAKAEITKKQVQGTCSGCANWRQDGTNTYGHCWEPTCQTGVHETKLPAETCSLFYAKPTNSVQVNDIVEISVGDQWQVKYIGKKQIVCADKTGAEHTFDLKGLRFKKC